MELINLIDKSTDVDSILQQEFAYDVRKGLGAKVKSLSSKYLYDDEGSRLFKRITGLDAYYLTRTEQNIINSLKNRLPKFVDSYELDIIELGVGDGHKSSILINAFLENGCDINFYPIDISLEAFVLLDSNISRFEYCHTKAVVADYQRGLQYCTSVSERNKLVLFLGSNIGNFNAKEALKFLVSISQRLSPGDYLLVGFDLKKDIDLLLKAYDDDQGLTRKFNLNLLNRINREFEGEFDVNTFQHLALYNPRLSAMESYLLSLTQQHVPIKALDIDVSFDYYEPIHLESSFKYNMIDIQDMSEASGFKLVDNFIDDKGYFIDSLWKVADQKR